MGDSEHMLASAADHLETRQLTSITCHITVTELLYQNRVDVRSILISGKKTMAATGNALTGRQMWNPKLAFAAEHSRLQ